MLRASNGRIQTIDRQTQEEEEGLTTHTDSNTYTSYTNPNNNDDTTPLTINKFKLS